MAEILKMDEKDKKIEWKRSIPKNVRQIGEGIDKGRIYIEDYVVTYLNRIARPDQAYARGAVLFGNVCETEEGTAVFISGAVEAGNLELHMEETVFDELVWYDLTEEGKKYFPGQEVVGWFLSRMGFTVEVNQIIKNVHCRNFPGDWKVLYMIDSLEKEDCMYLWENQQLRRQRGYYIYYENNSAMQDYMLERDKEKVILSEERMDKSEIRRDKKIINSYRRIGRDRKEKKKQDIQLKAIRAACAVLICIMAIGIVGKISKGFHKWGAEEYTIATFQAVKNAFMSKDVSVAVEEVQKGENELYAFVEEEVSLEENTTGQEEQTEETMIGPKPLYYIVKKGDTLAAISRKMYSSDRYAEKIAGANRLTNADQIYEGQKILIPSIE